MYIYTCSLARSARSCPIENASVKFVYGERGRDVKFTFATAHGEGVCIYMYRGIFLQSLVKTLIGFLLFVLAFICSCRDVCTKWRIKIFARDFHYEKMLLLLWNFRIYIIRR